jgi:L-asparaginase
VPALSGDEIVARVPGLRKDAHLTLEDYARLPGPHVTPEWMWRLKKRVAELLADRRVDGVVITHGTDTIEETAYLLDLTLDSDKPVVLCGAMRTISDVGWDGPANLRTAVRTAANDRARGRGVLVAVGEQVHSAAEATKVHTQNLAAFRSPRGPIGELDHGRVVFVRPAQRAEPLRAKRLVAEVDLHVMATGTDPALLRASVARGVRGLVIEGTGCGNLPPSVLPIVQTARKKRVPIVLVSRCAEGRVAPLYGYAGGGLQLREMGLIFGGDLPGQKARIRLMVALGVTSDQAALKRLFEAA